MSTRTFLLAGAVLLAAGTGTAQAREAVRQDVPQVSPAPQPLPSPEAAGPTMQILPGSEVRGSDGTILGRLEGVHTVSGTQELKVRGSDGVLRSVPLMGLKQDGTGVAVALTAPEFQAAPELQSASPDLQPQVPPAMVDESPPVLPDS